MDNSGNWVKGTVTAIAVILASLLFSVAFSPDTTMGWITTILVAMVPAQMVVSLLWNGAYPARFARLPQPWRGLAFFVLTALICGIVVIATLLAVGGGLASPTPMVNMYLIFTVPVALSLIIPFQGWPFNLFAKTPGRLGVSVLVGTYVLAFVLYRILFNFAFLSDAPFYQAALDPGGLFIAWTPLVLAVASVAMVLMLVLFDFWPVTVLVKRFGFLGRQPMFGIIAGVLIALGVWALHAFFVVRGGMDLVVFQTNVCVSLIFGIFIVLVMFEGMPMLKFPQPWRGLLLVAIAIIFAVAMFYLYRAVAVNSFGLTGGVPPYAQELWLASCMLAVTFPAMVFYANYFQFWPFPAPSTNEGRG